MSDTEEQIQERARKRAEAREKAESEQRIIDLLAKEKLEEEYDGAIATVKMTRCKPGLPTFAVVRAPMPEHYKRFKGQTAAAVKSSSASAQLDAVEMLAKASWVYPAPNENGTMSDAQAAMLDGFPGILATMGNAAVRLAEGSAAEEGKG